LLCAICQLYHGENNLIADEILLIYVLY